MRVSNCVNSSLAWTKPVIYSDCVMIFLYPVVRLPWRVLTFFLFFFKFYFNFYFFLAMGAVCGSFFLLCFENICSMLALT